MSDGGVHSHIDHAKGLLAALKELSAPPAFLHFFSDGRDTKPTSGVGFMKDMLRYIESLGYGSLATVTGRYYLELLPSKFKHSFLFLQTFYYSP